jgi:hypothetical protein
VNTNFGNQLNKGNFEIALTIMPTYSRQDVVILCGNLCQITDMFPTFHKIELKYCSNKFDRLIQEEIVF